MYASYCRSSAEINARRLVKLTTKFYWQQNVTGKGNALKSCFIPWSGVRKRDAERDANSIADKNFNFVASMGRTPRRSRDFSTPLLFGIASYASRAF